MIKKMLFNMIKKDSRIRELFISELTQSEKCKVLETIDYDKIIVNTKLENNSILNLQNSIIVNCKIKKCNIEGNIIGNLFHGSIITGNNMMGNKNYKPLSTLPKLNNEETIL